ncbi:MAG TPA: methyltransferase domain-containing protein [Gammaproteobacteria bacterium]|nr:methyltransferase domain-containing protein [Gammaproteobacteria bacterium]
MSDDMRAKWDARYRDAGGRGAPAVVLAGNAHLLPERGRALDMACGLGSNALLLAERGLTVEAWDLSPVAIDRLNADAAEQGLSLQGTVRDVVAEPPLPASFDVIVVAHFLERSLCPAISAALRPGGLLFYQTFTRARVTDTGPGNPAFRLERNELLHLFADLSLVVYREEARIGKLTQGFRDQAMLVAQKV